MFTLLTIFIFVTGLVLLAGARAKVRLKRAYPPAGRMIDIGGCRLHVDIQGEGPFTVVFESGMGGTAAHWEKVQPEIAGYATTISYDRAGLGWSDPGRQPRSFEAMAGELRALLTAAHVPGPFVLVGHSSGGVVARCFAAAYPELVAGLILVDSAHEQQFTQRFPAKVRAMAPKMIKSMKPMRWVFASGIPALLVSKIPLTPGLSGTVAQAERAARVMSSKHMRAVLDEMAAIVHCPPLLDTLGSLPLVVLSHGVPQPVPNMSDEVNAAYEAAWQEMQRELARLSSHGQHIIVEESGHDIQLENPHAVIDAIRQVIATIRETA